MFNPSFRKGYSTVPGVMFNLSQDKMAAPNNAYYVLTQAHAGLPNSVLGDLLYLRLDSSNIPLQDVFLAQGTYQSGWTETGLGVGVRLLWYPRKAAFRAGGITIDEPTAWNDANIGNYSFAGGGDTIASGGSSVAFGYNSQAKALGSTAFGLWTYTSGAGSLVFGYGAIVSADYSAAGGYGSSATGTYAFAFGRWAAAIGTGSFALGYNATNNLTSLAAGTDDTTYGSIALGYASAGNTLKAEGTGSIAMGQDVNALTNDNVLVFGRGFSDSTADSFNIGFGQLDYQFTSTAADFKDSVITTLGSVGIGTASPTKALDILSNTSNDGFLVSGSGSKFCTIKSTSSSAFLGMDRKNTSAGAVVVFYTNGIQKCQIGSDNDGTENIHIGGANLTSKWMTFDQSTGDVSVLNDFDVTGVYYAGGTPGVSGSFTTADVPAKTVTVTNGIITAIV